MIDGEDGNLEFSSYTQDELLDLIQALAWFERLDPAQQRVILLKAKIVYYRNFIHLLNVILLAGFIIMGFRDGMSPVLAVAFLTVMAETTALMTILGFRRPISQH